MKKSILQDAVNIAQRNLKFHPEYEHFIHFSFIVQKNKIIEWGTNNRREPAKHYGYHNRIKDKRYLPKTHSEVSAFMKAKGILSKEEFEIINIRLNKKSQIRMSKPCSCCYQLLKSLGCNKFYYSSEIGFMRIK